MCKANETWASRVRTWRRNCNGQSGAGSHSRWQRAVGSHAGQCELLVAEVKDAATSAPASGDTTDAAVSDKSAKAKDPASAEKQAETQGPIAKVVSDSKTEDLIASLAATYASMIAMTAETKGSQRVTPFHAIRAPAISVPDYMKRLFTYFKCSEACLLTSLIYIDRVMKLHPGFQVSERCIHRVLATSLVLSAKFNDDVYYSNAYYAKVSGLSLKEMNTLEVFFLKAVNWSVSITTQEYEDYHSSIVHAAIGTPVR